MANKHTPKKNSADFGIVEHYYFEIMDTKFYQTQEGWKFLEKDIQYYLKYWRQVLPNSIYQAVECKVLP